MFWGNPIISVRLPVSSAFVDIDKPFTSLNCNHQTTFVDLVKSATTRRRRQSIPKTYHPHPPLPRGRTKVSRRQIEGSPKLHKDREQMALHFD